MAPDTCHMVQRSLMLHVYHAATQALGDVDELNSAVGLAREFVSDTDKELADKVSGMLSINAT